MGGGKTVPPGKVRGRSLPGRSETPLWSLGPSAARAGVVGVGENSLDHIQIVETWPEPGGKIERIATATGPGGQMATALLGCARLGLRAAYLGAVGADPAAELVLQPLERAGVDVSRVQRVAEAPTRSAVILVRAADGERSVLAGGELIPRLDLGVLDRRDIAQAGLLHVDASDPDASRWAARIAREAGIPVVVDADRPGEGVEALISLADFPVVSEAFVRGPDGTGPLEDGLAKLAAGGPRLAVVTRGARGAIARHGEDEIHSPAIQVDVRDTTGAGDAFHAGLIWALFHGYGAQRALRAANTVAGLSCTAPGAQAGLPDEKTVRDRLNLEAVPPAAQATPEETQ